MSPKETQKSAKSITEGFSDFERTAMKECTKELKAEERMNKDRAAGENAVLEKIGEME